MCPRTSPQLLAAENRIYLRAKCFCNLHGLPFWSDWNPKYHRSQARAKVWFWHGSKSEWWKNRYEPGWLSVLIVRQTSSYLWNNIEHHTLHNVLNNYSKTCNMDSWWNRILQALQIIKEHALGCWWFSNLQELSWSDLRSIHIYSQFKSITCLMFMKSKA